MGLGMSDSKTKTCFVCSQEKPIELFYKHKAMKDGRLNKCKECTKSYVLARRWENIESERERDRIRSKKPHRASSITAYTKKWREENPEKASAHASVARAVKSGKISKPSSCEMCGDDSSVIHGHHKDYSKPLDVDWLCPVCHALCDGKTSDHGAKHVKSSET